MKKKIILTLFALLITFDGYTYLFGPVPDVTIKNSHNKNSKIIDLGKKPLIIIYTDYEARKFAEPLGNLANKYRKNKFLAPRYRGLGIINLKDNPLLLPNWLVRSIIRSKERTFHTTFLLDEDHTLLKKWNLGYCDDRSVVMIIGKDKKIKFFKKIINQQQCYRLIPLFKKALAKELKINDISKFN